MQPKISIITPVYNGAEYIKDCISSVLSQSYTNKEHIIVDGLSKDDTMNIVNGFTTDSNVVAISEQDKGIYDAMNKGIKKATGDYLFFLGADDVFYNSNVLSDIFNSEENYNNIDILYGKTIYSTSQHIYGREVCLNDLKTYQLNHQTIFYHKRVFEKIGNYEIKYRICADAIFNIKCFKDDTVSKKYIDIIISKFNDTGLSNSSARDLDYQKDYLTLFDNLTLKETLQKLYYRVRPDWFTPTIWLNKL